MEYSVDIQELNQKVRNDSAFIEDLRFSTSKVIIGQNSMMDRLLLGLLANGHILLEGLPGLAKTLAIRTLASAIDVNFKRIQFTPDLLPSDIIGTMIYNPAKLDFFVSKGPVFTNFILADEINRAPAKVQSALLEAMQEHQVTIGKETFNLPDPFLVMATQNPIEQEGTYPLPEAQVDRFLLKIKVSYPSVTEEKKIIKSSFDSSRDDKLKPVVNSEDIIRAREIVKKIYIDDKLIDYIVDLVFATRNPENYKLSELKPLINYGSSPRASIALATVAKAHAFINRRGYVVPEDIKNTIKDVLAHRIGLSYEAEAENISQEDIITKIVNTIEVP
ncbi:MAG: MoxR family ATPase [Saprospiraceae bacterium]|nr:MoxR family ATPase [Saprospiraceae bacterium]